MLSLLALIVVNHSSAAIVSKFKPPLSQNPLFSLKGAHLPSGTNAKGGVDMNHRVFSGFSTHHNFPGVGCLGSLQHVEAVYFVGAFLLLVALIYGTLNWHYRDRRRDRMTNQIVRDRYEYNRT